MFRTCLDLILGGQGRWQQIYCHALVLTTLDLLPAARLSSIKVVKQRQHVHVELIRTQDIYLSQKAHFES